LFLGDILYHQPREWHTYGWAAKVTSAGAGFYDLEDFCPQNVSGMKKVPHPVEEGKV
jgi:hypothetical protein